MARPFGIPVYVSPSWLIIAAIITVLYQPMVDRVLLLGHLSYLVAFVFAVLLYVSVLVHELAHSLVARAYGLPVRRITLYMLGGVSEIDREAPTPGREFWVAFSGPLLSLVLAGIGYLAYLFVAPATVAGVLIWQLWVANLLVGVFNLLPGLPLDGGRILRAGVWGLTRRPSAGVVVAAWVGRSIAVLVATLPFLLAWWLDTAPNVFGVLWAVLLGAFLWMGATSALRTARVRERLPALRARALARRAIQVPADTPVAEVDRRMATADAGAAIVTDAAGTPTSLLNGALAAALPAARRPWTPVSEVSRAVLPGAVLPADLAGEDLLEAMRAHRTGEYLLVERDGSLHGVLYTRDVDAAFADV